MNHPIVTIIIAVIAIILMFKVIDDNKGRDDFELLMLDALNESLDTQNALASQVMDMPIYVYRISPIAPGETGVIVDTNNPLHIVSHIPNQWEANARIVITQLSDEDANLYMRGLL